MPLVSSRDVLKEAREKRYAVGAFNANNLEMVQAIVEAAEEERAPVILQASQGAIKYIGLKYVASMVKTAAREATVPVVLHLDHGVDFSQNVACLHAGFTSLMFDGSLLSFKENVAETRRVTEIAHIVGIPVEGEIGRVPHADREWSEAELKELMTSPREALEFYQITKCDSLAVSVGSVHQMKVQGASLDIERIQEISQLVGIPLVLHGASGVTDESIKEAIGAGITKINIATHLAKAFTQSIKESLQENPDTIDPRKYLGAGREAMKEAVKEKMRLLGCSRRV